jgi:hypothetical protein
VFSLGVIEFVFIVLVFVNKLVDFEVVVGVVDGLLNCNDLLR